MGVFLILIAACIASEAFWWIVGIIAVIVIIRMIVKAADAAGVREVARAKRLAEIAARADQQHQWYIEGDSRGSYGKFPPVVV